MPYNVDKDQGGDSKENTSWMEECVSKVMSKDSKIDKSSAIAICKAQLKKNKDSEIDPLILNSFSTFRSQWIRKSMSRGESFNKSNYLFQSFLAHNDYEFTDTGK